MPDKKTERRLVENELLFKQLNEQVQKGVADTNSLAEEENQPEFKIQDGPDGPPLLFYCECSDENCTQRLFATLHEYKEAHKQRDHFMVIPGHQVISIEKVVKEEEAYNVIEKFKAPPESVGQMHPTNVNNS